MASRTSAIESVVLITSIMILLAYLNQGRLLTLTLISSSLLILYGGNGIHYIEKIWFRDRLNIYHLN